jgi:uncharacterized membrane protein
MWCAYGFLAWSLLPLVADGTRDLVFYVSGAIIQLVALPLIMVGQKILNRQSEERAEEDHQTLLSEFAEMKALHECVLEELADLKSLKGETDEIKDMLDKLLAAK